MSADDEWVPMEAAIRHVAKARNESEVLAERELGFLIAESWIAVTDREGYRIDPNLAMELEEVFVSRIDLMREFPVPRAAKAEAKAPLRHPGGRPTTHDWAEAAGFLAWYIVQEDPVQAVAVAAVERWFSEEKGKAPDQRDLERFVSAALKEWGRRKQGETQGN